MQRRNESGIFAPIQKDFLSLSAENHRISWTSAIGSIIAKAGVVMQFQPAENSSPKPKTVLIVEDDHATRVSFRQVLENEEYRVLSATNGRDALRLLTPANPVSLIFLDLMMPLMDGAEFLQRIQLMPRLSQIPVVVISAIQPPREVTGVQRVLRKPIDLKTLIQTAERHCA